MDSPLPIVSEAMTAPGPKNLSMVSSDGRRSSRPSGAGGRTSGSVSVRDPGVRC